MRFHALFLNAETEGEVMTRKAQHPNEDLDEMRKDMDTLGKVLGIPSTGQNVPAGIKKSLDATPAHSKKPVAKTRPNTRADTRKES
ncbi:MAG: hypothetical protein ABIW76_24260 [Fibrobacteria bacterium]